MINNCFKILKTNMQRAWRILTGYINIENWTRLMSTKDFIRHKIEIQEFEFVFL